jgi:hypothetical protein
VSEIDRKLAVHQPVDPKLAFFLAFQTITSQWPQNTGRQAAVTGGVWLRMADG